MENVLVYVSGVFNFSFCYCFYKCFIPKIILVGQFLPFNLQIWHWNPPWFMCSALTENFEQTTTGCSFFMPDFISHVFLKYFSFHTLLIMICWKSTEVLLNLAALLDSPVSSLALSKSMLFELPVLISLVFFLNYSVSTERSLNCISHMRFRCSFFGSWVNQYMVHDFD